MTSPSGEVSKNVCRAKKGRRLRSIASDEDGAGDCGGGGGDGDGVAIGVDRQ